MYIIWLFLIFSRILFVFLLFSFLCMPSHFSRVWLFETLWTVSLCPWDSLDKNTGVGSMPFAKESSRPRDRTHLSNVSCFGRQVLYPLAPPGKPPIILLIDIHTYHTTTENSCVILFEVMLLALRKLFSLKYQIFNWTFIYLEFL